MQLLFIEGLYYTSPNIAGVIQPAVPIFTALLAIATCTEPPPPLRRLRGLLKVLGILCVAKRARVRGPRMLSPASAAHRALAGRAVWLPLPVAPPCWRRAVPALTHSPRRSLGTSGAVVMNVAGGLDASAIAANQLLIGNLMLIGNTMCMAIFILLQKRYVFLASPTAWAARLARYPITMTAWSYVFGATCMGFAGIYYVGRGWYDRFRVPVEIVPPLAYAILVSSALCYGLLAWANKHLSATVITAFWPAQVPFTVVMSYFVFHDQLEPLQCACPRSSVCSHRPVADVRCAAACAVAVVAATATAPPTENTITAATAADDAAASRTAALAAARFAQMSAVRSSSSACLPLRDRTIWKLARPHCSRPTSRWNLAR